MKDELSYIDNIAGDKLKEYSVKPVTGWELMNSKLSNVTILSTSGSLFSKFGNFITSKLFVVSVVILSVVTAGIFIFNNTFENSTILNDQNNKTDRSVKGPVMSDGETTKSSLFREDDSLTKEDSLNNKTVSDDILINVEVPVHKNVIIKKEIFIRDTINE